MELQRFSASLGLEVSRGSFLQDRFVELCFREQLLQTSVFFFNLLETFGLIHPQTTVSRQREQLHTAIRHL